MPYQLHATLALDIAAGKLRLTLGNDGMSLPGNPQGHSAAVFQVQPREVGNPRFYTVTSYPVVQESGEELGRTLNDELDDLLDANGRYAFEVHGPNGFFREFHGNLHLAAQMARPEVSVTYQRNGNLQLNIRNLGRLPCSVTVTPNPAYTREGSRRYELEPNQAISEVWLLRSSQGWYDLSVTASNTEANYLRRLAGHVENRQAEQERSIARHRSDLKRGVHRMRPTLTWTLLALLLCGTAIGAVLLLYPSEPAPVAPFASPPQATPAAKPSIPSRAPEMNTATAPDNLEQQLGEFGRNAGQMSEIERKQAAEGLIEQLKREVAVGADPRQTFEEIQRLTPYVEADARRREALDFEIWMALKDNASVQQQAPTPGEEEQLREYAQESDKVIAEVLASVDDEEQRHAAIDERLKALRKQIFGEENPRLLQR